ncbi:MAG: PIG-L deacetylase family protein [Thermoanaerobaculia bacterium]
MRFLIGLVAALTIAAPGLARVRPVNRPTGGRILWVAAHPDDELLVAPFLASRCRQQGALCAFAVATRGEGGTCELPSCSPDLATVRTNELATAAAYLGAFVIAGSLPDGSLDSSSDALEAFVRGAMETFDPDLVVTFDPRHARRAIPTTGRSAPSFFASVTGARLPS